MAILPLQPAFVEGLRRLDLVVQRRGAGANRGERTSARKGQGIEFADHRGYVPGDEPRFLDWCAFARTGRPVVKEFLEESDLALTVFVDASASMRFGRPSRLDYAATLASVFCRVAIGRHDRAGLGIVTESGTSFLPPVRGTVQGARIEDRLGRLEASGASGVAAALRRHFATWRPLGVVLVITDLYDPEGPEAVVDCLVHHGVDASILMITDDEEGEFVPRGPVEFVDSESGETLRMLVTPEIRDRLRAGVHEWRRRAVGCAQDKGVTCVEAEVHRPIESFVAGLAARGRIVR
jgi:uncharacterized protein (DUF58 family)